MEQHTFCAPPLISDGWRDVIPALPIEVFTSSCDELYFSYFSLLSSYYNNIFVSVIVRKVHFVHRGGRGVVSENLGGGVQHASRKPYPISDQNMRFSLPYF